MIGKLIRADDWEALYINGNLIDEGHHLDSPISWIEWTNKYKLESLDIYFIKDEDIEELESSGSFPLTIEELKGNYN